MTTTTVAETDPCFYQHSLKWVIKNPKKLMEFSESAGCKKLSSPVVEFYLPETGSDKITGAKKCGNKLIWKIGLEITTNQYETCRTTLEINSQSDKLIKGFGVQYSQSIVNAKGVAITQGNTSSQWFKSDEVLDKRLCVTNFPFLKYQNLN